MSTKAIGKLWCAELTIAVSFASSAALLLMTFRTKSHDQSLDLPVHKESLTQAMLYTSTMVSITKNTELYFEMLPMLF